MELTSKFRQLTENRSSKIQTNPSTVVLEIFAGIQYILRFSLFFKKNVIFNIALANQNHNNQKEWFYLMHY